MAASTLTAIPLTHRAGDSLLLSLALDAYPADESWEATFTFRKSAGTNITFTGTADADGTSHLFNVPDTDTTLWQSGVYSGIGRVSDGTTSHTFWTGRIEILPDLAVADPNFDGRTTWQRIHDNVLAVLDGRADKAILTSSINGVSLTNMSHDELIALYDRAKYEVQREADEDDVADGKLSRRNILMRFTDA